MSGLKSESNKQQRKLQTCLKSQLNFSLIIHSFLKKVNNCDDRKEKKLVGGHQWKAFDLGST